MRKDSPRRVFFYVHFLLACSKDAVVASNAFPYRSVWNIYLYTRQIAVIAALLSMVLNGELTASGPAYPPRQ